MREWGQLALRSPVVAAYRSPDEALAYLASPEPSAEDLDQKDELLAALVQAIQHNPARASVANAVLWLALWRALGRVVRFHCRFSHDFDEGVSEVADRFAQAVRHLRVDQVERVAVTLLRNTKRELHALRRAQAVTRRHEVPLLEPTEHRAGDREIRNLELRLILEKAGSTKTVDMLLAALAGMTAEEIGRVLGGAPATVQKQMNRALNRLGRRISAESDRGDVRSFSESPRLEECGPDARGRSEMPELKVDRPERDPRFYEEFLRLPGVFRRWELEQIVDIDCEYRFEDAGLALDGSRLISVYRRETKAHATVGAPGGGR